MIWISIWLLLPVAGALVARASSLLPEPLRDPVKRLGWLTAYSTLPVGIAGLALTVGKNGLPPDDFLWVMLRTYDLHKWTHHQVWMKPGVLAPLLGAAGILSIAIGRPDIIARFGRLAGLIGQAVLSLYVLSLFSLVAPGPFEMKLNETTTEMRGRLQASLQLQSDAEKLYLAHKAVMVLLRDNETVEHSHLVDVVRDAELIARRLGCARDAERTANCGTLADVVRDADISWRVRCAREFATAKCGTAPSVRAAFEQALPNLNASDLPDPVLSEPKGLPALKQAVVDADALTAELRKKVEASKETVDATIHTLGDLLPLGEIARSVLSEIAAAVASRFGDVLVKRSMETARLAAGALDELGVSRLVADVPPAITHAAASLHDAVVRRGPWVLVYGADAAQKELDLVEGIVKDIEKTMPPGSTVNAELDKRIRERRAELPKQRGPRGGADPDRLDEIRDDLIRSERLR